MVENRNSLLLLVEGECGCGCGGGSNSKVKHLEMCDILDLCRIVSFTIMCNFLVFWYDCNSVRNDHLLML